MPAAFIDPDDIRTRFSRAMSDMYRLAVPQSGALMSLVADVNTAALGARPDLRESLERAGEIGRLSDERHGAIRLGTAGELATVARLFAVMGMQPVGYYDLAVAGIPVHSTAFRPVDGAALARNPFRVFTSLLRLDLVADEALRAEAAAILARRRIFTPRVLELIAIFEGSGGLSGPQSEEFVREALETFRWHSEATVDRETYARLAKAHRLVADVVCFKGPHINHLTPRTLDIEAVQRAMPGRGIDPKAVIEGPPERRCPILLRQTSFKALDERILFIGEGGGAAGTHSARFGEVEQRGAALTPKGRALYDRLLADVRGEVQVGAAGAEAHNYAGELGERFRAFPDDWAVLRKEQLAWFRYAPTPEGSRAAAQGRCADGLDAMIADGHVVFDPVVYEDFLPVSAAGIFQSNLGTDAQSNASASGSRSAFEAALGRKVRDEIALYAEIQAGSVDRTLAALRPAAGRAVA